MWRFLDAILPNELADGRISDAHKRFDFDRGDERPTIGGGHSSR